MRHAEAAEAFTLVCSIQYPAYVDHVHATGTCVYAGLSAVGHGDFVPDQASWCGPGPASETAVLTFVAT